MAKSGDAVASTGEVVFSVVFYALCSSFMLVVNKVSLTFCPLPATLFCIQLVATVLYIVLGKAAGMLKADNFTANNVRIFLPYIVSFVLVLYSNGKALDASNVETVILFRSCTPIFVSVVDYLCLGREAPSLRSAGALLVTVLGAVGFVLSNSEFEVRAYSWCIIYTLAIVFEMTYGKSLLSGVTFEAPLWSSTLYTNTLGLPAMAGLALVSGEGSDFKEWPSPFGWFMILLSCVLGTAISWAGWNCREKVSATSFTLLGVTCKFISVLLNVMIWDKHATPMAICCLMVCLCSSSAYKQAPMRKVDPPKKKK
eukprot:gnl/TRDRNA2_/TRDRNA2_196001_c0_seq1.p1 gnl/TRDRNA2_/TRDRNA2_196001_c0~~gnl/TRDRNA2_/TRDRNA2_196001_c0_seq1.p1  ORF type:complete len:312 (+),score=42.03 gnl/TRDRNA2_/TRDRNA2_196001_c0_seq1:66-1001(+)